MTRHLKELKTCVLAILVAMLCVATAHAEDAPKAPATSLISNGDFETLVDGKAKDWGLKDNATLGVEDGNHFLRLKTVKPGETVMVYRLINLPADAKALELKFKVRYEGIKVGKQNYFDGRIMMNFLNAEKKKTGAKAPAFKGSQAEWKERSQQMKVPEGAESLEMMFTLFQAEAGQLDFDDVTLTPIDAAAMKEPAQPAAPKSVVLAAAIPVPDAASLPPELKVKGNQIVDANGKTVWLQGVAVPSLEWNPKGDNMLQSCEVAIRDWKANVIRIPVKDAFWNGLGEKKIPPNDAKAYQQLIDDIVNYCSGKGVYVVIDLHRFRAPREEQAVFWKEVAEKYKNNPAVLFELFNEAHGISWEIWKNGGVVTDKKKKEGVVDENNEETTSFTAIGHQQLIDTVRATGAKNIVIVGGLDWSYDLSGVLNGFELDDKGGNGIVYSTHVYPWKSKWKEKFMSVAEKHPIFIGETGAPLERYSFIPPSQHEDPYTWVPDMLGVIQQHKYHWTAWAFHPKCGPEAIKDWNYTPTAHWGAFAKQALLGEKTFEVKKLR